MTLFVRIVVAAFVITEVVSAQTPRPRARRERISAGSVDPVAVRAEYASALMQSRRYREAAAEYRRLLQQQPEHFDWRLNYARVLALTGDYRQAQTELERLAARAPRHAGVEQLLRSVRANIEPSSREAQGWVAEQPANVPYRLALARAYVRERRPRLALEHFEAATSRQASAALFAESADAHMAAGEHRRAADLYRRAVDLAPSDARYRRGYAHALVTNRQYAAALQHYDVLLRAQPDAQLLLERAEVKRQGDDLSGALRDLEASVALRPTADGYFALAETYRWRGQFSRARDAYERAAELRPADRRISMRLALLSREERPGFGYASMIDEQAGVVVGARGLTDNTGFAYALGEARVGFALGKRTVIGVGVEPRLVYDRTPEQLFDTEGDQTIVGTAVTAGLSHTYHAEETSTRIAGRGGFATHNEGGSVPVFGAAVVLTHRVAWSLSVEGSQGPAYSSLMAIAATDDPVLLPIGATTALLTGRTVAVAGSAPFGRADVAARFEHMALNDGNARSAFQASVRMPLLAGVSLLYSGGSLSFHERSTLYWDPPEYVSHAVGLELGKRTDGGVAVTARVLPGVGRAVEGLTAGDPDRFGETEPLIPRYVGQLSATLDLGVRRERWDTALGAAFATGRQGGYRRFEGHFRVRYTP